MPERGTRVLIADDQKLFAVSLRYVLEGLNPRLSVIGIAANGEEAVAIASRENPDVILMDVRMPVMDGVEATRIIHRLHPDIRIIMLTTFDDDEYVHHAVRHGAAGYLLKNLQPEELLSSIRAVLGGQTLFSKDISAKLVDGAEGEASFFDATIDSLSRREREVLDCVLQMMNNTEIGDRLGLSEQSVRNYVSSLYSAFGINDRMELIRSLRKSWNYRNRE